MVFGARSLDRQVPIHIYLMPFLVVAVLIQTGLLCVYRQLVAVSDTVSQV